MRRAGPGGATGAAGQGAGPAGVTARAPRGAPLPLLHAPLLGPRTLLPCKKPPNVPRCTASICQRCQFLNCISWLYNRLLLQSVARTDSGDPLSTLVDCVCEIPTLTILNRKALLLTIAIELILQTTNYRCCFSPDAREFPKDAICLPTLDDGRDENLPFEPRNEVPGPEP